MNNLKQLGGAFGMLANDHEGTLPGGLDKGWDNEQAVYFLKSKIKNIGNQVPKNSEPAGGLRVFVCKSHKSKSASMPCSYTLNCAEDSPSQGVLADPADFRFKSEIDVTSIDNPRRDRLPAGEYQPGEHLRDRGGEQPRKRPLNPIYPPGPSLPIVAARKMKGAQNDDES